MRLAQPTITLVPLNPRRKLGSEVYFSAFILAATGQGRARGRTGATCAGGNPNFFQVPADLWLFYVRRGAARPDCMRPVLAYAHRPDRRRQCLRDGV
jgi:hypothetical protein